MSEWELRKRDSIKLEILDDGTIRQVQTCHDGESVIWFPFDAADELADAIKRAGSEAKRRFIDTGGKSSGVPRPLSIDPKAKV